MCTLIPVQPFAPAQEVERYKAAIGRPGRGSAGINYYRAQLAARVMGTDPRLAA